MIVNDKKKNFDCLSLAFVRADCIIIVSGFDPVQLEPRLWVVLLRKKKNKIPVHKSLPYSLRLASRFSASFNILKLVGIVFINSKQAKMLFSGTESERGNKTIQGEAQRII